MDIDFSEKILQLVEKKIGLKPHSTSHLVWSWALKERLNACHLSSLEEYYKHLILSPHELQELIEYVVVPETWFFRDRGGYDFLLQHILTVQSSYTVSNILSLACSSGEEPYSIAMLLSQANIPFHLFKIDAMDISQKALIKAQQGIYGKNSFRGKDLDYQNKYFTKENEHYSLQACIKNQVRFYHGNIIETYLPFEEHSYEVIFCRNLFIYLNPKAQQQTFEWIKKLLVPRGLLFVGPAETQLAQLAGFQPIHFPKSYAFINSEVEKTMLGEPLSLLEQKIYKPSLSQRISQGLTPDSSLKESISFMNMPPFQSGNVKDELIKEALKLADEGEFEKSGELCLRFIHQHGVNADIYYLLGLIEHAGGKENEAREFFHKTVYLQPSHYEALIYLALLYEKEGDLNKAELFRKRAQKNL